MSRSKRPELPMNPVRRRKVISGARSLPVAAVLILCLYRASDSAGTAGDAGEPPVRDSLDRISGPLLETTVVGLRLQGERPRERYQIPDLDILLTPEGERLLPLLRTLGLLEIDYSHSGTSLRFRPEGAPEVFIDYAAGRVVSGSLSRVVPLVVGISDVTLEPEIFLGEELFGELVAADIEWNEQAYEYAFRTDRELRVFRQRFPSPASLLRRAGQPIWWDLPGELPPAEVGRYDPPDINLAAVRLRARLFGTRAETRFADRLSTPQIDLWGQLLGGSLAGSMSRRSFGQDRGFGLERVSWTTWSGDREISAGDSRLGIAELVFPYVDLAGVRVNGLRHPLLGDRSTRLPAAGRESFLPSHVFEGFSPEGAKVSLFINGREVDSQLAEPSPGSPPGMGLYRFEGLNLLTRRLNDVRIVSEATDGTKEETRREVLGTDLLLPAGATYYQLATGSGRPSTGSLLAAEGFFAASQLVRGVTPKLTLGFALATQNRLYRTRTLRWSFLGREADWLPSRSLHLGSRLAWQPAGRIIVTGEAARSDDLTGAASGWAAKLSAEIHRRSTSIRPSFFWYAPAFFDGHSVDLRDRFGAGSNLHHILESGDELSTGLSHIRDNLDGGKPTTTSLTFTHVRWSTQSRVPQSILAIGGRQFWVGGGLLWSLLLDFDTDLVPGWKLQGNLELGDDLFDRQREDLVASLRFGHFGGITPLTTRLRLSRRTGENYAFSLSHRSSANLSRSFVSLTRSALGARSLRGRISLGYDWQTRRTFLDHRMETPLDVGGSNRIVLENRFYGGDWSASLWLQLNGVFGFVDRRPFRIRDRWVNPETGGVKGRVFLDFNANGLLDAGEPGIEGIGVVTDSNRQTASGKSGEYVLPGPLREHRVQVSLDPNMLPAIYTPTQATRQAVLLPGVFPVVNLGVAAFGSVSGRLQAPSAEGDFVGIRGVRIRLLDSNGRPVGDSITGWDGEYFLGQVRPGKYTVMIDRETLPADFEMDVVGREVEILSGVEPFEVEDVGFLGEYATPPADEVEQPEAGIEYRVFE